MPPRPSRPPLVPSTAASAGLQRAGCQLPLRTASTTSRIELITSLRLLLVYLVAAVRVGDVLCVRHELGELLLGLFLRGVGDVAEVQRNVSWQSCLQRSLTGPDGPQGRSADKTIRGSATQLRGGANLVEAAMVQTTTVAIACTTGVYALLFGRLSGREGTRVKTINPSTLTIRS